MRKRYVIYGLLFAMIASFGIVFTVSAQQESNCMSSVVSGDPLTEEGLTINVKCVTTTTTVVSPTSTTTTTTTTTVPTTTTAPPTTTTTTTPPQSSWPNASNTGPTGPLTPSGTITVTTAGTVIENREVTGCIRVRANNVVIRNVKVNSTCYNGIEIRDWEGYTGLLIEDVEVDGRDTTDNCIAFGNFTARRVHLHRCADGAKLNNGVIESSYITDLMNANGCHCDGIQNTGGTVNTKILNNNIDVPGSGASIMFGQEYGPPLNAVVSGNRLNGGNHIFYGSWSSAYAEPRGMQVTNNTFGPSRRYGTHVYVHPNTLWSGNVNESNGSAVVL